MASREDMSQGRSKECSPENPDDSSAQPAPFAGTEELNPSRDEILVHPVKHYDAEADSKVSEVISRFGSTGFQSRNLARCLDVLMQMLTDPMRPIVYMGLAGAMVPGGLRKVVRDMIRYHMVDVLVSTGANLTHDLYESLGYAHYLAHEEIPDAHLRKVGVDRMYDVYLDDDRLRSVDGYAAEVANKLEPQGYSSREFMAHLGQSLQDGASILKTAAAEGVPIFCPAISDSSIGIALARYRSKRVESHMPAMYIDVIKDNLEIIVTRTTRKRSGAIILGGGVPKNYIQQISPQGEVLGVNLPPHSYGIQLTTDDPKWGGLSGCTFEESKSWGKYENSASFATVYIDATIGMPLLLQAALDLKDRWHPREPLQLNRSNLNWPS